MTRLGEGLFGFTLFWTLCASWACATLSFSRLGTFSIIISSNSFSVPCSLPPLPSGALDVVPGAPQAFLTSWIFFSFALLTGCLLPPYLPSRRLSAPPRLICRRFPLMSSSFPTRSFRVFYLLGEVLPKLICFSLSSLSVPTTAASRSAPGGLLGSVLFSSCSGALFCPFVGGMFLCLPMLAASLCLFLCIRQSRHVSHP